MLRAKAPKQLCPSASSACNWSRGRDRGLDALGSSEAPPLMFRWVGLVVPVPLFNSPSYLNLLFTHFVLRPPPVPTSPGEKEMGKC